MPSSLTTQLLHLIEQEGFKAFLIDESKIKHAMESGLVDQLKKEPLESEQSPMETMMRIFAEVTQHETPMEHTPKEIECLHMPITGEHGKWPCVLRVYEKTRRILAYSILPVTVPEHQRAAIAEMLHRINFGLIIGNFELDWADGEIRYKTYIAAQGVKLSKFMVRHLLYGNFFTVDRYLRAIYACLQGDNAIEQLIYDAEHDIETHKEPLQHFELIDHKIH